MGFSQSDVTADDRKRAEEILDDINMAYVTAQECGSDEGRAAERELAYSIGLIRAQEREKFADVVEALRLCLSELEERFDLESSSTNPGIKVAASEARDALAKAV